MLTLILVICVWHAFLQDIPLQHSFLILSLATSPLLLIIPSTLSGSYRGTIWACFVSLFYFVAGILNWGPTDSWLYGLIETCLAVLLFVVALMYARWKGISELTIKD